jgi:hypothetical protein
VPPHPHCSCPAGRYGSTTGINSASCTGLCTAGYYCPAGSSSATAVRCGGNTVYCPPGAPAPVNVSVGHFSVGTAGMRSDQQQCGPGTYCLDGVATPCPVATFSDTSGAVACTGVCFAGYTCAAGSSSGNATECIPGAYCPSGDPEAPILCPTGRYRSLTRGASMSDCSLCPAGTYSNSTGEVAVEGCLPCAPREGSGPGSSVCWPGVVNVTADDPEPVLPGISDGDTLTLRFTKATNAPPVGDANDLAALLAFSAPLYDGPVTQSPTRLTGRWVAGNTQLVLTLMDTRNVSIVDTRIGLLAVNVTGVRDASGLSSPLEATWLAVVGTWGQSSTPRFLANGRGFEVSNTGGQVRD